MHRLAHLVHALVVALALAGLAGCLPLLIPDRPPAPTIFDFGPLSENRPAPLPLRVELELVEAPTWLEGPDIHYRRLDEQPSALRSYAQSQWVASVPELLAQRLRHRLTQAMPLGPAPEASLRLEVLSFEQVFPEANEAYVSARAYARLEDDQGCVRGQEFDMRRASAPEVAGATSELPGVADDLVAAVLDWLRETDARRPEPGC